MNRNANYYVIFDPDGTGSLTRWSSTGVSIECSDLRTASEAEKNRDLQQSDAADEKAS